MDKSPLAPVSLCPLLSSAGTKIPFNLYNGTRMLILIHITIFQTSKLQERLGNLDKRAIPQTSNQRRNV